MTVGTGAPALIQVRTVLLDRAALIALLVVLLFAAIGAPAFFNPFNLQAVATQASIIGIVTAGQSLVLLSRGFDLSVGAVAGMMAMVLVNLGATGDALALPAAMVVGIGLAALVGSVNGWLVAQRNVAPFVATLGMLIVVDGARFAVTAGQAREVIPPLVTTIGRGDVFGIPIAVLFWIGIVIAISVALHMTRFGREFYASGSSPDAAASSGVPVYRLTIAAYIACAICAALAGIVLTGNVGYVDQSLGTDQNLNLNSIAAGVLAGVFFTGGEGLVVDTIAAVLLLVAVTNLIVVLALPIAFQLVAQGGVLLAAVLVQAMRAQFSGYL